MQLKEILELYKNLINQQLDFMNSKLKSWFLSELRKRTYLVNSAVWSE